MQKKQMPVLCVFGGSKGVNKNAIHYITDHLVLI